MTAVVQAKKLSKTYGRKLALDNISISLEENGIVGLIGRNGAGKTTLLKLMAGYIRPSAGEINLWGESVFDNINVLSRLSFVDEEVTYEDSLRIGDILDICAGYFMFWDDAFARKLLRFFKLDPRKHYKKLSRGMKTQFNIIAGIASRSPLTLLDEPTLGLDAAVRKEFYSILLQDYMDNPRTIVISSHLLSEMENLLTEIVLVDEGKLVLQEPIEVMQQYGVYVEGEKEAVLGFAAGLEVWETRTLGNSARVAVRSDFGAERQVYVEERGLTVRKIPVQDVCIYMTGGGDRYGAYSELEG